MSEIFDSPNRPFYRSTQKLALSTITEKNYYLFAAQHMSLAGITLPQEIFHSLYQRFDGHTWYVQNLLNHIYEVASPQVSKQVVDDCLQEIILSEADNFARLYRMLTANQAQLLHAIALEGVVPAINASHFITSSQGYQQYQQGFGLPHCQGVRLFHRSRIHRLRSFYGTLASDHLTTIE